MSFSKMLATKVSELGVSASQAATKAGISIPSFLAALKGKSKPNARSVDKYASFLGVSAEEIRSATASASAGTKAKAGKRGRPAGAKSGGKRRGRPPGSKNGTRRGRPPGAKNAKNGKRRGRPPGSARGSNAGAALASIASALKSAEALLNDRLAVAVHGMRKQQRSVIQALVTGL